MQNFIKEIAVEAGKKILKSKLTIKEEKQGVGNWTTDADIASENFIIASIKSRYPKHKILSEETFSEINEPEKVENLWIIDPLDGTTNAKFSLPFFAVSIAYMEKGALKFGVVHDPSRDELFWAEKGKGAFLNGMKIKVLSNQTFKDSIVDVGCPYLNENFLKVYPKGQLFYQQGARIVNFGSAALECAYVASARLSFYFETALKPWDVAAGKLLIEEAGGVVDSLGEDFSMFNVKEVLAGNSNLVSQAKKILKS